MDAGLRILLATLSLCIPQIAAAESLPDPTRPAIDLSGGAGAVADIATFEAAPRGLQSTIISPQYRAAIINGVTVRLGDTVGDSRLVEVRESSVVLQNAQGRRVMELFPKVNIKMNDAAQQKSSAQEKTNEQQELPEKAAGGDK
jgi:MSHA biogenesis protein MshK